jgi:hypothetical protein
VIETKGQLGEARLAPGDTFSFACRHPGLAYFNICYADK